MDEEGSEMVLIVHVLFEEAEERDGFKRLSETFALRNKETQNPSHRPRYCSTPADAGLGASSEQPVGSRASFLECRMAGIAGGSCSRRTPDLVLIRLPYSYPCSCDVYIEFPEREPLSLRSHGSSFLLA